MATKVVVATTWLPVGIAYNIRYMAIGTVLIESACPPLLNKVKNGPILVGLIGSRF